MLLTLGVALLCSASHYLGFRVVFYIVFMLYMFGYSILLRKKANEKDFKVGRTVRLDVLRALGKMDTPGSLEMLRKMSHDPAKIVRDEAARYLEARTEKRE